MPNENKELKFRIGPVNDMDRMSLLVRGFLYADISSDGFGFEELTGAGRFALPFTDDDLDKLEAAGMADAAHDGHNESVYELTAQQLLESGVFSEGGSRIPIVQSPYRMAAGPALGEEAAAAAAAFGAAVGHGMYLDAGAMLAKGRRFGYMEFSGEALDSYVDRWSGSHAEVLQDRIDGDHLLAMDTDSGYIRASAGHDTAVFISQDVVDGEGAGVRESTRWINRERWHMDEGFAAVSVAGPARDGSCPVMFAACVKTPAVANSDLQAIVEALDSYARDKNAPNPIVERAVQCRDRYVRSFTEKEDEARADRILRECSGSIARTHGPDAAVTFYPERAYESDVPDLHNKHEMKASQFVPFDVSHDGESLGGMLGLDRMAVSMDARTLDAVRAVSEAQPDGSFRCDPKDLASLDAFKSGRGTICRVEASAAGSGFFDEKSVGAMADIGTAFLRHMRPGRDIGLTSCGIQNTVKSLDYDLADRRGIDPEIVCAGDESAGHAYFIKGSGDGLRKIRPDGSLSWHSPGDVRESSFTVDLVQSDEQEVFQGRDGDGMFVREGLRPAGTRLRMAASMGVSSFAAMVNEFADYGHASVVMTAEKIDPDAGKAEAIRAMEQETGLSHAGSGDPGRTMFWNLKKGDALPGRERSFVTEQACVPVAVLFNENSTCGEVVPLRDVPIRFVEKGKPRASRVLDVTAGENIVLGMDDLSDRPLDKFRSYLDDYKDSLARPADDVPVIGPGYARLQGILAQQDSHDAPDADGPDFK